MAEKDFTRRGRDWMLDTTVYDFAGVCRFYMGLAHEIRIVESQEFQQYVRDYTQKYLK